MTAIRYRDVARAAKWLQVAFGFDLRAKVVEDDGRTGMVQLTYGNHLVMILPVGGSELDIMMRQPDEIGGAATQSCYLVVDDIEQHQDRARVSGAEIVSALKAFDKGGYGYTCRDLEGHLWSFGSYDPWSEPPAGPASAKGFSLPAFGAVGAVVVLLLIGAGWGLWHAFTSSNVPEDRLLGQWKLANEKADQAIGLAARSAADLAKERAAKKLIQLDALRAKQQLALERDARQSAEKLLNQSETNVAAERSGKIAANEAAVAAKEAAANERAAKEAAELAAAAARKELTLASAAKLKAERMAKEATEQLAHARAAKAAAETLVKEAQDKLKAQPPAVGVAKAPNPPAATKKAANTPSAPASAEPMPPLLP